MRTLSAALTAIATVALCACSTPQVALDQANHGVGLISELELSLSEFRRVEQNAEDARRESLREQMEALEVAKKSTNRDARARKSAGDADTSALIERLIADADGMAADDAMAKATQRANDAALAALLAPLPSTSAAMATAQKKLAEMGTELPWEKRYSELLAFAKAIKEAVDANKKKIADAEAAAAKK